MAERGNQPAGLCQGAEGKVVATSTFLKELPIHCALVQGKQQQNYRNKEPAQSYKWYFTSLPYLTQHFPGEVTFPLHAWKVNLNWPQ